MEAAGRSRWELTEETLHALLETLSANPAAASTRYRMLYGRLVFFFLRHRCVHPEDQADKVIDRLAAHLRSGMVEIKSVEAYSLGIARLVLLEYQRSEARERITVEEFSRNESLEQGTLIERETMLQVLEQELGALPEASRDLLQAYHAADGNQRIAERRRLAEAMQVTPNTLRKRIFDLQSTVRKKIDRQLRRQQGTEAREGARPSKDPARSRM